MSMVEQITLGKLVFSLPSLMCLLTGMITCVPVMLLDHKLLLDFVIDCRGALKHVEFVILVGSTPSIG